MCGWNFEPSGLWSFVKQALGVRSFSYLVGALRWWRLQRIRYCGVNFESRMVKTGLSVNSLLENHRFTPMNFCMLIENRSSNRISQSHREFCTFRTRCGFMQRTLQSRLWSCALVGWMEALLVCRSSANSNGASGQQETFSKRGL